jgi:hypothetical protein
MNQIIFLLLLIILALGLPLIFNFSNVLEGYSNYSLDQATGNFPDTQTKVLVQNTYPPIGKNQISDNTANDIWWHYPIFKLGSYAQITNNIRYPDSPDEGTCMPASMCGALYYNKKTGDNYIKPLPPVDTDCGTRVGYFTSDEQLIDSLPFRTDMQNILY